MKNILLKLTSYLGYNIVKSPYKNLKKYKANSNINGLDFFDTPTGKYYLPDHLKNDFVSNAIKSGEIFEEEVISEAKKYIKENTSVLDIGANYGQMSILFSAMVGKGGKVYSFEAMPFVFEVLTNNVTVNNCTNIQLINNAVYNKSGKELIFPKPDLSKFSSLGSFGIDPDATNGYPVKSITIDDIKYDKPISFMKIDIQGSDLFALQGAHATIMKYRMPIIFEYEEQFQSAFKTSFQDYVDFVKSIDYYFEKTVMGINYLILPVEMRGHN
jgi:FkbM family methyltransferase